MGKKKYIFFDIDHTLVSHVNGFHIPNETREAIKLLKTSGHVPAIATGRASFLTFTTAKEFDIDYIVSSGGAEIFVEGKEIYTEFFPDEHLEKFCDIAKKFPDITAAAGKKFLYTDTKSELIKQYFNAQAGYDCIKTINEMQDILMCYIMLPYKALNSEHGIFYSPSKNLRLEIMNGFTEARHEKTSKWRGIELLIEHEHANMNDVITFGDGPNDVEMLKNANIGVAVKKSSEEAQKAADFICGDIDERGILKACYELELL